MLFSATAIWGQGLHFSQYFNAPMLLNPANTALLQNNDWRAGAQFRNQWATVPVNYNTLSGFADFGLMRNQWETSWIGTGLSFWRDVAGAGSLSLTKVQASLAYHVLLNDNMSLSLGMAASHNQRSVDFSKLTFDVQWDEFSFNRNIDNQETYSRQSTSFLDLSTGMNFAYYNNNNLYVKLSAGAMHINQPVESFYGMSVKRGLRPIANIDITYKATDLIIINPSFYYTRQKKASELVVGSLFNINMDGAASLEANELILGGFVRNKDAVIAAAGYKFGTHRIMFSYDHTISQMAQANSGMGAFELSWIKMGNYAKSGGLNQTYGCPRF